MFRASLFPSVWFLAAGLCLGARDAVGQYAIMDLGTLGGAESIAQRAIEAVAQYMMAR